MSRERLIEICGGRLKELNLWERHHQDRFKEELLEIDSQADHEYFIDLYDRKAEFAENENNLFTAYLLGLVKDYNPNSPPKYIQGEFPDIDVDFLKPVRDYLKNDWAPKQFGADRVCNIGNYTTFGIKSSLIDMAKVHGESRDQMLAITTKLGLKDDEGETLTFDRAVEIFEDLQNYIKEHPEVGDAAQRLLNRNRGVGQHAGGLIIANSPVNDVVPLMRGKDGSHASAWTEGLHSQDLQPVGYVKFDLLVISDLYRIVLCNELIKKRHDVEHINALPDLPDWSDIAYLNDKKALALANDARLKGVFQFDSFGIRRLCKEGGVTSFDDLAAYSAIFRPGPLGMKMHKKYIDRKQKAEIGWEDEIPDVVKPVLLPTYGVMCYQEQVMQILNLIGDIPLIHCEKVRKAISKKYIDIFAKFKKMFVEQGMKKIGWSEEQMNDLWDQIESFAAYGFNKSHAVAYTYISSRLLWQKAHYPLEFFTATLQCEEKDKKIKEYKLDAERFGIEIQPLSMEYSEANFAIVEEAIYIGFGNVKGVGSEIAQQIADKKPYKSFPDFLQRFGLDAKVVKPLVSLGVFGEDRVTQWAFYEDYKKNTKKRIDRQKRHIKSREKFLEQAASVWRENMDEEHEDIKCLVEQILTFAKEFGDDKKFLKSPAMLAFEGQCEFDPKELWNICKKYRRSIENFQKKELESDEEIFNVADYGLATTEDFLDDKMATLLTKDLTEAQAQFYGFGWDHPLEESPDFDGTHSFYRFEDDDTLLMSPVECHIVAPPEKKLSKSGKVTYYDVKVQDSDFQDEVIRFWEQDYDRFAEELEFWDGEERKGHFVRMSLMRPKPGFSSYNFSSPSRRERYKIPKDKSQDGRLIILRREGKDESLMTHVDGGKFSQNSKVKIDQAKREQKALQGFLDEMDGGMTEDN